MSTKCLLDALWFHADVSLCGGRGAVLQEPLHQGDVLAVVVIDFRCEEFTEGMSADVFIILPQVVTYQGQMMLDSTL